MITYQFTDWELFPKDDETGGYVIKRAYAFLDGVEICSVPGVMSMREWNSPARESIKKSIDENLAQSIEDCAQEKLGLPPYEPKVRKFL